MSKICDDLRASILQAAMQGKLTNRNSSDDSPELMKDTIIKERSKYKPSKYVNDEQNDFIIPEEWCSLKTGEVFELLAGENDDSNEKLPLLDARYFRGKQKALTNKGKRANKNDILILVDGENSGETFTCIEPGYIGSTFKKLFIPKCLDRQFALYFLEMNRKILRDNKRGAAIPHLDKTVFFNFVFPIPSFAEQKRIVAKVDELMARVADLEKSADALASLKSHYPDEMRASLLQAAMQGKLTEQLPSDGNADELLRQIQAEKEKLIASGKIKKSKPAPAPPTESEIPFSIPDSWKWVRFGELVSIFSGLAYNKKDLDEKIKNEVRVLRGGNITNMTYCFKADDIKIDYKFIPKEELFLRKNQLITPAVTSQSNLGKIARIDKNYDNVVAGGFVLNIVPFAINNEYLSRIICYFFSSPYIKERCNEIANKSGQAFYNLNRTKLQETVFPLPPLAEQKRIVERLDEAMNNINVVAELIASE